MREELRKVQSSAALLERQRNPGVGFWSASRDSAPESPRPSSPASSSTPPRNGTPRAGSPSPSTNNEEEVNLEYLRNVILQFLEHKEMRVRGANSLSVLGLLTL